jgi:multiple sugar transport system ATP-binding protein
MARLGLRGRIPVLRVMSPRRRVMRQIAEEVRAVAAQLHIEALLDRRPAQLSGGQRQRVALGRAMVRQPSVFLMDEPLSNLDAKLRVHMRAELMELHARLKATFIYVTHDQTEAMTMSDRVAMMHEGRVLQNATPAELYENPASRRVAEFIGSPAINLFPARVDANGRIRLLGNELKLFCGLPGGTDLTLGLRPESLHPGLKRPDGGIIGAELRLRENLGAEQILHFRVTGQDGLAATCRLAKSAAAVFDIGQPVELGFALQDCLLFRADGERIHARTIEAPAELGDPAGQKVSR